VRIHCCKRILDVLSLVKTRVVIITIIVVLAGLTLAISWVRKDAVIIIALTALVFTIFQGMQQRQHNRLSVRPILQIGRYLVQTPSRSQLGVFLKNEGAGIAIIDKLNVRLVGVKKNIIPGLGGRSMLEAIARAIHTEHPGFPLITCYASIARALAPNTEMALFTVDASLLTSDWQPVWQDYVSRMAMHIEYKSLYNEPFVVDMQLFDRSSTVGKEITV